MIGTNGSDSHSTAADSRSPSPPTASSNATAGAVPGVVLDNMFADEGDILFLKVDVEGFEGKSIPQQAANYPYKHVSRQNYGFMQ